MTDEAGDSVSPEKFLSAAARYQLAPAIDRWVVRRVLSTLGERTDDLARLGACFAVNISGQSLGDQDFCAFLEAELRQSGLPARLLTFELTETAAVANIVSAESLIRRLRELGFGVALDDLGRGLSSLTYLKTLPVTTLKIDGSFVRDVIGDDRSQAMLSAIVQLARAMGLATVAECVESGQIQLSWLEADLAPPTRRLASVVLWIFALVMAYPYLPGAGTDAFKGLSLLIGLMVSIGSSSLVAQAGSGLILMYTRTLKEGEYVAIGESEGTVVALGMFSTRVRTGLGEELTLPNSLVLQNVTKNYSRTVRGQGFVLDTTVTIGYDTPWRQVEAMLIEAARRTPGVVDQPAPHVFQRALSDFYPEYRLVCQAVPSQPRPRAEVLSALHGNIQDVFNEHQVQLMSPHNLGDPGQPKVVPKEQWYAPPTRKPPE